MTNILNAIIAILVLFVGLPFVILLLQDRVKRARHRWRKPPQKIVADRRGLEERLLLPDWAFYERHLQPPAPAALRELYADRTLVTAQDLNYKNANRISAFGTLDEQGLLETRSCLCFDAVAIAITDFGDSIYLCPGSTETDTVYITHHDGSDTEMFAKSVAAMVNTLRKENHNHLQICSHVFRRCS
jgi:hypothetical protein